MPSLAMAVRAKLRGAPANLRGWVVAGPVIWNWVSTTAFHSASSFCFGRKRGLAALETNPSGRGTACLGRFGLTRRSQRPPSPRTQRVQRSYQRQKFLVARRGDAAFSDANPDCRKIFQAGVAFPGLRWEHHLLPTVCSSQEASYAERGCAP